MVDCACACPRLTETRLRGPARQPLPARADRLAGYANQDGYPGEGALRFGRDPSG